MHKSLLLSLISAIAAITVVLKPSSIFASHWNFSLQSPSSLYQLNGPTKISRFLFPQPTHLSPLGSTPTSTHTPTLTSTPSPTSTLSLVASSATTPKNYIMKAINDYRSSLGLSEVSPSPETCNFAMTRSQEISTDFSHRGFQSRVDSKTLPYSNYHIVTENIARTSNYREVVNLWINSPDHAENMRKDTPYVCVEGTGDYYAYGGWKP